MKQNVIEIGISKEDIAEKVEIYEKMIGNSSISSYYRRRKEGTLKLSTTAFQEFIFLSDGERILSHCFVDGFLDTKNCRLEISNGIESKEHKQDIFSKTITFLFDNLSMETIILQGNKDCKQSIEINRAYQPTAFSEGEVILENPKARV